MSKPDRIVIIGAGGHGREIADILRHQAQVKGGIALEGFVDGKRALHGKELDGLPVLGDWDWFDTADRDGLKIICAVGNPQTCQKLVNRAIVSRLEFTSAISPLAHISPRAQVGKGVVIFPQVIINTGARIGNFITLNVGASVSHDSVVGDFTNINPGVRLAGNVTVGEGCYIGMGANVIQGCSIGAWSTVGASAAVIRNIPPRSTAVGVPAKVIKTNEELSE
ncbi:MAG TPA: acetyltransferase [Blastocatellia bacterium]|nr:acetyltransferase [Blastocatellia bacterium]